MNKTMANLVAGVCVGASGGAMDISTGSHYVGIGLSFALSAGFLVNHALSSHRNPTNRTMEGPHRQPFWRRRQHEHTR